MTGSQWDALENQQSGASRDIERSSTASFHARALRSFEDRMRLRDTLSFEPQSVPTSDPDGPLPPVPESRDYSRAEEIQREIQHLSQVRLEIRHNLRRMARRIQPAPTPPYTEGEVMFMARAETNLRPPRNFSSFTPDLSLSPLEQRPTSEVETSTGPDSEFSFTARGPPYRSEVSDESIPNFIASWSIFYLASMFERKETFHKVLLLYSIFRHETCFLLKLYP